MMPCIDCGQRTQRSRCPVCQRTRDQASYYHTPQWRRLAKQATRGQACTICGSADRVTAHHAHARKAGGPDALENLIPMCISCHSQYEADKRKLQHTTLTQIVDALSD